MGLGFLWSYVLIVLAAFFNACMDTFENTPNFNESIFKGWNKRFWCKDVSCEYAKKLAGYKFDSWHISKSLMCGCVIMAVAVAGYAQPPTTHWGYHICALIILWNLVFVVFYHLVFRVK